MAFVGGLMGFVVALFCFIALMCIWSNTGSTSKYLYEMVQYIRTDRGLDPLTGKLPKAPKGQGTRGGGR